MTFRWKLLDYIEPPVPSWHSFVLGNIDRYSMGTNSFSKYYNSLYDCYLFSGLLFYTAFIIHYDTGQEVVCNGSVEFSADLHSSITMVLSLKTLENLAAILLMLINPYVGRLLHSTGSLWNVRTIKNSFMYSKLYHKML